MVSADKQAPALASPDTQAPHEAMLPTQFVKGEAVVIQVERTVLGATFTHKYAESFEQTRI